jgi:hypothetical protein
MALHNVFGRQVEDGMHRREGRSKGKAHLVVCTNGDFWYVDRDLATHDPAEKKKIDELYNLRHPGTTVVRYDDPPR